MKSEQSEAKESSQFVMIKTLLNWSRHEVYNISWRRLSNEKIKTEKKMDCFKISLAKDKFIERRIIGYSNIRDLLIWVTKGVKLQINWNDEFRNTLIHITIWKEILNNDEL